MDYTPIFKAIVVWHSHMHILNYQSHSPYVLKQLQSIRPWMRLHPTTSANKNWSLAVSPLQTGGRQPVWHYWTRARYKGWRCTDFWYEWREGTCTRKCELCNSLRVGRCHVHGYRKVTQSNERLSVGHTAICKPLGVTHSHMQAFRSDTHMQGNQWVTLLYANISLTQTTKCKQ